MSVPVLRLVSTTAILAAVALSAGGAASEGSPPLPIEIGEIEKPAAAVSGTVETDARTARDNGLRHAAQPPASGPAEEAAGTAGVSEAANAASDAVAKAPPASRLLRSLDAWSAQPATASPPPLPDGATADVGRTAAETAIGGSPGSSPVPESSPGPARSAVPGSSPVQGSSPVLHGCPRALLAALLAEATETADAVSALAIERETLSLCRERQEIVNGIVALEGELQALLSGAQDETGVPGTVAGPAGSADAPIVKVSAPVRVIEMAALAPVPAETAETNTPPTLQSPAYSWFSIVGTAGDLRAGISRGARNGSARGGTGIWFLREGDRLPGGVTVTRIAVRPPGVHVEGAVEGALPYSPRPSGATRVRDRVAGDGP